MECTLLARWDSGYREPWLLVTDLPKGAADVAWYGLRAWIECGYKDSKRGGWQWQATKMTSPARAERLWLVLAVATLWVVSVGCEAEAAVPVRGVGGVAGAACGTTAGRARREGSRDELFQAGSIGAGSGVVQRAGGAAWQAVAGGMAEKS